MALPKKLASSKRYGARYGKKLKTKAALIEAEVKKKHECPSCRAMKAKRLAVGIWKCTKCNAVFTGKAYTTVKKTRAKEAPVQKESVFKKKEEEETEEYPALEAEQ